MLEKLFQKNYLNYKQIILDNFVKLELTPTEAVVLINMLEEYLVKPNFKANDIVNRTGLKKTEIQEVFLKLVEADFYITQFQFVDNIEDVFYSFKPFFTKIEQMLDDNQIELQKNSNEKNNISNILVKILSRTLLPTEEKIIDEWVKKGLTVEETNTLLSQIHKNNIINFKIIKEQISDYIKYKR